MIADDGTRELVWRQDDVAEPACRLAEADAATFAATSELHVQSAGGYLPFAVIDFPAGVSATKMRFPYLIGEFDASRDASYEPDQPPPCRRLVAA